MKKLKRFILAFLALTFFISFGLAIVVCSRIISIILTIASLILIVVMVIYTILTIT